MLNWKSRLSKMGGNRMGFYIPPDLAKLIEHHHGDEFTVVADRDGIHFFRQGADRPEPLDPDVSANEYAIRLLRTWRAKWRIDAQEYGRLIHELKTVVKEGYDLVDRTDALIARAEKGERE